MKLFVPELGNIFFKICTIIWAFTAFLTINSKELGAKINQFCKLIRFYFLYSPICENLTISSYTSILTKNVFLVTLKAKYQNVPIKSEFCYMTWVIGSLLANLISKTFWGVHETPCMWVNMYNHCNIIWIYFLTLLDSKHVIR